MSCINLHCKDSIGSYISATIQRVGCCISATIQCISDVLKPQSVSIVDLESKHLNVRCSIVCSLEEFKEFLNVSPQENLWITDDVGVFYDVESNVEWIIVIS